MQPERITSHRRHRPHRLLFVLLISLLVGFSLWSTWILVRAQELRHELDLCFGWLDRVQVLRGELERQREPGTATPLAGVDVDAFRRDAEDMLRHLRDPALDVALQSLRRALEPLSGRSEDSPEVLWQASVAALAATEDVERETRGHVRRLYHRLGSHWRALWLLIPGALVLAASNFGLLWTNQRRRLELETAHSEALRSALHDPLTGLWNRDGILRLLHSELMRATRSKLPLGVILADLENFQAVNEMVGHDQGDYILEQVGQRLQSMVRPYDTMGRVGGDSFLVVLPACDADATRRVAERLVESVNAHELEHAFGRIRVILNLAQQTVEADEETNVDVLLRRLQEGIDVSKTSIARPTFT